MESGFHGKHFIEARGLRHLSQSPDHLNTAKLFDILWRNWYRCVLKLWHPGRQTVRCQPFSNTLGVPGGCIQAEERSGECMDAFVQ